MLNINSNINTFQNLNNGSLETSSLKLTGNKTDLTPLLNSSLFEATPIEKISSPNLKGLMEKIRFIAKLIFFRLFPLYI